MIYDHATKAGNAGDLHKHAVLSTVANYIVLTQHKNDLCFIDAYAGLTWEYFIPNSDKRAALLGKLTKHLGDGGDYPAHLEPWLKLLRETTQIKLGTLYPGSSFILSSYTSHRDYVCSNDIAAETSEVCDEAMPAKDLIDLWPDSKLIPNLLFMDPSYTVDQDRHELAWAIRQALEKWPNVCVVYWSLGSSFDHPVVSWAPAKNSIITTYTKAGQTSSMCIFNPPDQIEEDLLRTMDFLVDVLGGSRALMSSRLEHKPGGH